MIQGGIVITVADIGNGWVKLGIEAPKELWVHREEVARQVALEGKQRKLLTDDTSTA
jgi:carbon storage regulator CsrA